MLSAIIPAYYEEAMNKKAASVIGGATGFAVNNGSAVKLLDLKR